jgi:uncharacterized protein
METLSPENITDTPAAPSVPGDQKPKTAMEHWLKRQFPGHSLKGMLEALSQAKAGVPVPYLAFFQSDRTGGLKSADLYRLLDAGQEWEEIHRRQQHMLQEIQAQGKLTEELRTLIERSADLDRLEDLYAPFKLKRQTLGAQAREAGLGDFADYLWKKAHNEEVAEIVGETLEEKAATFAKPDSKYPDAASVLKGAQDILVERIAESFELRSLVRAAVFRRSKVRAAKGSKAKPNSKYAKFFEYQEPIGSLKKPSASHRYLAMRRGWMEDELVLSFERPDEGVLLEKFEEFACPNKESLGAEVLAQAARLALKGNVYTVMENEAHRHLKEESERHVIETLGENLRKKLLRAGLGRKAVMGIDPGSAQHPCSLALVDQNGKLVLHLAFKLEELTESNKQEFLSSLENLKIEAIAVAHGPRAKEVRDGFRKILEESGKGLPLLAIHEHTSSIYSSSPAAKEEFPSLDVNTRRAIFVARYLQDPLATILKLDPKFLSLGEFQHEVNQGRRRTALPRTIEGAVNFVGVDPSYSPAHVLAHVSGLNVDLARQLVQGREQLGGFKSREDLKKVPGLGDRYTFAAGFLRPMDSAEPLDKTFIHPDFYEPLRAYAAARSLDLFALTPEQQTEMLGDAELAGKIGAANVKNAVFELTHFGEDPRGSFEAFEYDASLKSFADLKKDAPYPGVVTNVTSFGAFVDIGIEQDGLVHISELSDALAKNPFDSLFPGDMVTVWVSNVNEEKKQISLTMKNPAARAPRGERRPRGEKGARRPRPPRGRDRAAGEAPAVAAEGAAPAEGRPPRGRDRFRGRDRGAGPGGPGEGGEQRPRFRGKEGGPDRPRREEKDRKPKKPTRDPKTGAIVKLDEVEGRTRGGPRMPSKAKPHTFNPFANLADLLKDKQEKPQKE